MIALRPCKHLVCEKCIRKQLMHDARCCLCRTEMVGVHTALQVDAPDNAILLIVYANKNGKFGLTFKKTDNGVLIVSHVTEPGRTAGISVSDQIYSINNLPVRDVKCALQILKASYQHEGKAELVISKPCATLVDYWRSICQACCP